MEFSAHQVRRLRSPPRPQRLLAARGRAQRRDARQARQGRRPAGAGDHRRQQPVRRPRIFGKARQVRDPADHRRAAHRRFLRRAERRTSRVADQKFQRAKIVLHRQGRARLPQPDAARLERLARPDGGRRTAPSLRRARRLRRPHRADRRPGGAARPRACFRHGTISPRRGSQGSRRNLAIGFISSCSAMASTASARSSRR